MIKTASDAVGMIAEYAWQRIRILRGADRPDHVRRAAIDRASHRSTRRPGRDLVRLAGLLLHHKPVQTVLGALAICGRWSGWLLAVLECHPDPRARRTQPAAGERALSPSG